MQWCKRSESHARIRGFESILLTFIAFGLFGQFGKVDGIFACFRHCVYRTQRKLLVLRKIGKRGEDDCQLPESRDKRDIFVLSTESREKIGSKANRQQKKNVTRANQIASTKTAIAFAESPLLEPKIHCEERAILNDRRAFYRAQEGGIYDVISVPNSLGLRCTDLSAPKDGYPSSLNKWWRASKWFVKCWPLSWWIVEEACDDVDSTKRDRTEKDLASIWPVLLKSILIGVKSWSSFHLYSLFTIVDQRRKVDNKSGLISSTEKEKENSLGWCGWWEQERNLKLGDELVLFLFPFSSLSRLGEEVCAGVCGVRVCVCRTLWA